MFASLRMLSFVFGGRWGGGQMLQDVETGYLDVICITSKCDEAGKAVMKNLFRENSAKLKEAEGEWAC